MNEKESTTDEWNFLIDGKGIRLLASTLLVMVLFKERCTLANYHNGNRYEPKSYFSEG